MVDEVYFDGDPATDSARRHLERVLKEPESRHRKWPWVAGSVALIAAWYFWPHRPRPARENPNEGAKTSS